ncbi:MAG: ribbon-helix-helix protein, CopG family [Candidatus Protochlamydia sp.]|nr:ribbon-helix-helix protein, CopG family [Candidatus Protochlamydia sp.]
MFRTQIYLTQNEKEKLNLLSLELGKNQSTLIREAIDQFIYNQFLSKRKKESALKEMAGLWADRDDLPDFNALRKELDRE